MTVVAWDGRRLACDAMATFGDTLRKTRKMFQGPGGMILVMVGQVNACSLIRDWLFSSGDPEKFPSYPNDEEHWGQVVVWQDGSLFHFDSSPVPIPVEQTPLSWGSGMELALGAMLAGAKADRAVQLCEGNVVGCGKGGMVFDTKTKKIVEW